MKPAQFKIVYDGSALTNNEMSVNDLAPALLAIGELMDAVGFALHGDKFKIGVSVKGTFKTGCFGIEIIAQAKDFLDEAIALFNHQDVTAVLNAVTLAGFIKSAAGAGSIIGFLHWLKNRRETNREVLENGNVRIYVGNEYYDVSEIALDLLNNHKVRRALDELINKPLSREGIDTFAVVNPQDEDAVSVLIEGEEASYFASPAWSDDEIFEQTFRMQLKIISPSFDRLSKWRFSDDLREFSAQITDESFLTRVENGAEAFASNDILVVNLTVRQLLRVAGRRNKTDYIVTEVIEHKVMPKQMNLP